MSGDGRLGRELGLGVGRAVCHAERVKHHILDPQIFRSCSVLPSGANAI